MRRGPRPCGRVQGETPRFSDGLWASGQENSSGPWLRQPPDATPCHNGDARQGKHSDRSPTCPRQACGLHPSTNRTSPAHCSGRTGWAFPRGRNSPRKAGRSAGKTPPANRGYAKAPPRHGTKPQAPGRDRPPARFLSGGHGRQSPVPDIHVAGTPSHTGCPPRRLRLRLWS